MKLLIDTVGFAAESREQAKEVETEIRKVFPSLNPVSHEYFERSGATPGLVNLYFPPVERKEFEDILDCIQKTLNCSIGVYLEDPE